MLGKKGTAFNSTAPRFQSETSRNHNRSRTLNTEDIQKPVYDLQMLEGPQIKARNQLLNNAEMPDMRTIAGKHNTMGLGVFRSSKIATAFGTTQEPSYLQRSQQMTGVDRNNIKAMTSNAEFNIMQNQKLLDNERKFKEQMQRVIRQDDQMIVFNSSSPRFQDEATHQIRVLPGKDSVSGVNFRVKNDKQIGPGAYATPDEVEHMQKIKN